MKRWWRNYKVMRCWENRRIMAAIKAVWLVRGERVYLSPSLWRKP